MEFTNKLIFNQKLIFLLNSRNKIHSINSVNYFYDFFHILNILFHKTAERNPSKLFFFSLHLPSNFVFNLTFSKFSKSGDIGYLHMPSLLLGVCVGGSSSTCLHLTWPDQYIICLQCVL